MKQVVIGVLVFIIAVVLMYSLAFGATWIGIEWRGFFGPKRADVEREIFRETRSYDEGMIQQLTRLRLQYLRAENENERRAIASTVRTMFAEYDHDRLPNAELRQFLKEINR